MMSNDLNEAKQRLLDKLGPHYDIYIQLVGKWFRGLITKEEFDKSAKQLIEQNFVLEHNKFWLNFFHYCANNTTTNSQSINNLHLDNNSICYNGSQHHHYHHVNQQTSSNPDSITSSSESPMSNIVHNGGVGMLKCLPNKIITHMKVFVIAWEMGLDTADDHVSLYINLALRHFLKNIITELITTKTAYRLRENRFKYAIGVKPINPYLNNSLKIYNSNLEYDPYQIESNKMNSSLVDTYAYNDSLFPSRLYETQALYEYACSTTSVTSNQQQQQQPTSNKRFKRLKLDYCSEFNDKLDANGGGGGGGDTSNGESSERRLTLNHLLIAFLTSKSIMPQHLYSMNLERIFAKLSC